MNSLKLLLVKTKIMIYLTAYILISSFLFIQSCDGDLGENLRNKFNSLMEAQMDLDDPEEAKMLEKFLKNDSIYYSLILMIAILYLPLIIIKYFYYKN